MNLQPFQVGEMRKVFIRMDVPKKRVPRRVKDWESKPPPYTVSLDGFTITNVVFDPDGWADCKRYLPQPYEMVKIKTNEHIRNGWWNGLYWESLRLKPGEKILAWKVIKNET